MSLVAKAVERFVVPLTPAHRLNLNGVIVKPGQFWQRNGVVDLAHKEANCDAIRREVDRGDHVVVVGGGVGVSTVIAARATGPNGRVDCYEANSGLVRRVADTANRNNVLEWVEVHHAVVGAFTGGEFSIERFGEPDGEVVDAADLPDSDVLVMDCEGAEQPILAGLADSDVRPRTIIIETHGFLRAPTASTETLLRRLGYAVAHRAGEDPERDACVLTAHTGTERDRARDTESSDGIHV